MNTMYEVKLEDAVKEYEDASEKIKELEEKKKDMQAIIILRLDQKGEDSAVVDIDDNVYSVKRTERTTYDPLFTDEQKVDISNMKNDIKKKQEQYKALLVANGVDPVVQSTYISVKQK